MQELMLGKELETSAVEEIRYDSRKGTLAVLRILDGNRKGQVLKFLYESKLIGKPIREEAGDRWARGATIYLQTTDLSFADLRYANLNHANLRRADLSSADLFGVKGWTNEQLVQALFLVGATLPDGTVMTNQEAWEAFKKRYRQ
jgi:Pentapeptide repeats (8 copies)